MYTTQWASIGDPASNNPGRTELVRYDSPSWHGFIYSASIAEAGDYWGTMLRYANEFQGFRLAGTVGYERVTDIATPGTRHRSSNTHLHTNIRGPQRCCGPYCASGFGLSLSSEVKAASQRPSCEGTRAIGAGRTAKGKT